MPDLPWWGWVVLVLAAGFALAGIGLRLFRTSRRGRRFRSLSTRGKIAFGRALLAQRDTPLWAKALVVLLVGYLALPLDLVPDFLPIIGHADDFFVAFAVIGLLLMAVPRERFDAALRRAEDAERETIEGTSPSIRRIP